MSCSNCNSEMIVENIDNQIVLHCENCGSSFFEENGINRITSSSAFALSQDKKSDEISGQIKKCPKDNYDFVTIVSRLQSDSTDSPVPPDVTLLKCDICKGIFIYPEDLVKFKKAQDAKINYFKIWNIPLPTLQAIVVFSFIALVSVTAFSRFFLYQNGSTITQAQDIVKKVIVSTSGRYVFLSFKTQILMTSEIVFKKPDGSIIQKTISAKPASLHTLTTTDVISNGSVTYHLILTDEKGKKLQTEEKKLKIGN